LATAAAFLLLFGGAGYLILTMGPPRPSRDLGRVPVRAAAPETEPVSTDDADPAWKALGEAVNDALKRGRFDEALAAVAGFRARHPGAAGGELEALVARVQSDAEADVRRVLERGGELERQRQADAACAWYAEALTRFRGTRGAPSCRSHPSRRRRSRRRTTRRAAGAASTGLSRRSARLGTCRSRWRRIPVSAGTWRPSWQRPRHAPPPWGRPPGRRRGSAAASRSGRPSSPRDLRETVWYRSGDAHRSALKETWNCIGFGRDGRAAVLTFGNAIPPEGL
jgi:hypothetical protein